MLHGCHRQALEIGVGLGWGGGVCVGQDMSVAWMSQPGFRDWGGVGGGGGICVGQGMSVVWVSHRQAVEIGVVVVGGGGGL